MDKGLQKNAAKCSQMPKKRQRMVIIVLAGAMRKRISVPLKMRVGTTPAGAEHVQSRGSGKERDAVHKRVYVPGVGLAGSTTLTPLGREAAPVTVKVCTTPSSTPAVKVLPVITRSPAIVPPLVTLAATTSLPADMVSVPPPKRRSLVCA